MQRRDGFEGWSREYETAWDRIFRGDPSPEDLGRPAELKDMIAEAVADEALLRR
jgi:hypothetical protein